MDALEELFLEVEKHAVLRGHATLVMKARSQLSTIKRKTFEYECALIAIKYGKVNIPPEHSFGWWTEKKITTVEEFRKVANDVLLEFHPNPSKKE